MGLRSKRRLFLGSFMLPLKKNVKSAVIRPLHWPPKISLQGVVNLGQVIMLLMGLYNTTITKCSVPQGVYLEAKQDIGLIFTN